jgi:hypothetical protein
MSLTVDSINVLANAPAGSSSPDSITFGDGAHVWVAYTNGADSTGAFGDSTVVEYTKSGNVVDSDILPGYVDGLKVNPYTGDVWALQNQDGNSTLTLIQHGTGHFDGPLAYAVTSSTQGYDDVVFQGADIFMSRTNPSTGDATVVQLSGGETPSAPLTWTTVLTDGAAGLDLVSGNVETIPQNDPDSLKAAPNGDLLLSSGDDGVIIDIHNAGQLSQTVSFTPIQAFNGVAAHGLDDVIQPSATSGTFYIADTADNRVIAVHVTGLNPADYYASVGSFGAFGQVDPTTGVFTPLVSAANAPGLTFGSPHGVSFVPDPQAAVAVAGALLSVEPVVALVGGHLDLGDPSAAGHLHL